MESGLLALLAAIPIVVSFILLIVLRWSAARSMGVGWILATILGLSIWKLDLNWWWASISYGVLQALEIVIIIFGAVLLMSYLDRSGALIVIRRHFKSIQEDRRVQLLLIGFGFITIIEGVAGFGTPAALAAPLLIGLGFPPLGAAVFGLWFNAPNPPFGVAGIPTMYGVGSVIKEVVPVGMEDKFMNLVVGWTGVFTGITYVFWGFLAVVFMIYWFGNDDERNFMNAVHKALPIAPFAFVLGIIAGTTDWLMAWFVGAELPDIVVGFVTLGLGIFMARNKILMPARSWDFPEVSKWKSIWSGGLDLEKFTIDKTSNNLSIFKSWTPYLLVSGFLLVTRLPFLNISDYLQQFTLGFNSLMGTDLSFYLKPLYSPGTMPFIPVAVLTGYLHKMNRKQMIGAWKESFFKVLPAMLTLAISVSMVQIMIQSSTNPGGLPGMMDALSRIIALGAGKILPLVAPWLGVLGGFMTGSNTSSNILFSVLQYGAAARVGISRSIVVALQNTGGGIGNLISILNIAAIAGVIGMVGYEGDILRKTIIPTIIYAVFAGILGMILIYILAPGIF